VKNGFLLKQNFLDERVLIQLESILSKFHNDWCDKNKSFFESHAVNSAYITNGDFLSREERLILLKLIGSTSIYNNVVNVLGKDARFLNSQLFFDPFNKFQQNYWHRDIQYSGMNELEQKEIIESEGDQVVHFRLALRDEVGIELVPGSNSRWDDELELNTRLGTGQRAPSDDLEGTERISLRRGDLLIFNANMIHRGLYGNDHLAFDMIFCTPDPSILQYAKKECFPTSDELNCIDQPSIFSVESFK